MRDHHVVFDTDADVPVRFEHIVCGADVNARLNGKDHARLQNAAGAVDDVFARERVFAHAGLAHFRRLHIVAAVVHVHAHPVAGAVHVKTEIAALRNVLVQAAGVFVEQAQIEQPLGNHAHGGVVNVGKARACTGGGNARFFCSQHQIVNGTLRRGECAVGRKGARDVAGVAVELAARINQHQIARLNGRVARLIVQHAGIAARRHDIAVGGKLRAVLAEGVLQFGFQMVFAHIAARAQHGRTGLHGAFVGVGRDVAGAADDVKLVRIFDQAHFIQHAAQVHVPRRKDHAITHPRAHLAQPGFHARGQPLVGGKGVRQQLGVFHQLGQARIQLIG